MDKLVIVVLLCVVGLGQAASAPASVNYNQLVANVNRFKQNLDDAQAFVLSIWQGAIGGISAFWWAYSFWMLLGMFYYNYAYIFKTTKEAEKKELGINKRAVSDSLTATIFHSLGAVPGKYEKALADPCVSLVKCHARSVVAGSKMADLMPKLLRRMLGLDGPLVDCAAAYPTCSWHMFLFRMIQ